MLTSAPSAFLHSSRTTSVTPRTAVYGPVRTVVWQGSAGDCRPYADQTPFPAPIITRSQPSSVLMRCEVNSEMPANRAISRFTMNIY